MKLNLNQYPKSIKWNEGNIQTELTLDENGEIYIDGRPVETLEDHKKVLAILIRGLCGLV